MNTSQIFEAVRANPFELDGMDVKNLKLRLRLIVTNEPFEPLTDQAPVHYIEAPKLSFLRELTARIPFVSALFNWTVSLVVAIRLISALRQDGAAGLIDLGKRSGSLLCFLNSFKLFRGGPIVVYRALLPANAGFFKKKCITRALGNVALIAVWSRAQIENYQRAFNLPQEKFFFMPYKANHSKAVSAPISVGNYIFSGGDSERDYKTFFDAVRGLPIPVIVSTRKRSIAREYNIPENVILVNAAEPFYERLMAGSRLMAFCLKGDMIRGSGEATVLNAMWHGKPVVVADNISASDYIENGVDGEVVPAGDVARMRENILKLWEDSALASRMGETARAKVSKLYTHAQFKARMQKLAILIFETR